MFQNSTSEGVPYHLFLRDVIVWTNFNLEIEQFNLIYRQGIQTCIERVQDRKQVKIDFEYSSKDNIDLLDIEKIKTLIDNSDL